MKLKWLPVLFVLILIISCFSPWVIINETIVVSGFHSAGTNFGKPGIVHVFLAAVFLFFLALNKNWSRRVAFFVSAFNIAWAVRNFILISSCMGGICPEKQLAIFVMVISSLLMTLSILLIKTPWKI